LKHTVGLFNDTLSVAGKDERASYLNFNVKIYKNVIQLLLCTAREEHTVFKNGVLTGIESGSRKQEITDRKKNKSIMRSRPLDRSLNGSYLSGGEEIIPAPARNRITSLT
jgi:hypothetical protein